MGKVPGGFRGRFRITGSGKVLGQAPNNRFREGSRAGSGSGQVPNHGFREGSGAGSERQVPGRFWGRFRTTGSGVALKDRFQAGSGTTGSGKVPGQVRIHEFREVSGAGSERRVSGQAPGDRVPNAVGNGLILERGVFTPKTCMKLF